MITRYFLVTLGLFLGLTACGGGDKETTDATDDVTGDDDDDDDDDNNNPTGDTEGGGSEFFEPAVLLVDASFGYDSTTFTVVDASTAYGDLPAAIGLYLGTSAWEASGLDFAETAEYCAIFFPLAGAPVNSVWPAAEALWAGFDYDLAAGAGTSCNTPGYELDPAAWSPTIAEDWSTAGWGVGVGELWPDFVEDFSAATYYDQLFGGYIHNEFFGDPDDMGQKGYGAFAYQMDANYQLVVGEDGTPIRLDKSTVPLGNNIASAYYSIVPLSYWTFTP